MPQRKFSQTERRNIAQQKHDAWLLTTYGIATGRKQSVGVHKRPNLKVDTTGIAPLSNAICGNGNKRKTNTYTGDYVKGVATMHKSNATVVTSGQQAKDIARMT